MERLRNNHLSVSLDTVRHPTSHSAQQVATEQKGKAARAFKELQDNPPVRIDWAAAVAGAKNICQKIRDQKFDPDVFIARPAGGAIFASLIAIELSGASTNPAAVCKPLYVIQEVLAPDTAFDSSYVLLYSWEAFSWFVSNELNYKPDTKALLVGELSVSGESGSSLKKALKNKFGLQ
jgi:hypoxanthine phosphoribosyltransferase